MKSNLLLADHQDRVYLLHLLLRKIVPGRILKFYFRFFSTLLVARAEQHSHTVVLAELSCDFESDAFISPSD